MERSVPEIQRYAEALLALAEAGGRPEEIERELVGLLDLLECDEEVRRFLAAPTVRETGKKKALEQLLDGRISAVLVHFLLILQAQGALRQLRPIAEAFFRHFSSRKRKITGILTSAVGISPETVREVERQAGLLLGKEVHLRLQVDSAILGGLRVQVGDFVVDGTVEHDLAEARARLLA